jgi:Domain of unknown function (DUF6938)
MNTSPKAWVVSADMGYGHQRAVYPLKNISEEGIITVGSNESTPKSEKKLWNRLLRAYEFFSRAKSIPVIGPPLFSMLDTLMYIPSFYPMRNLSRSTFQVNLLESTIEKGLCKGMLEQIEKKNLPLVTSFYAPAIAADIKGFHKIYCIICDADINRVWVAKEPWESRIEYFAPCGKVAQRLKAYGVPDERIYLTGFPFPEELLGDKNLSVLKKNLGQRLFYLDPNGKFRERHGKNVEHFLGKENCEFKSSRALTITYAVGGAGAQKEIGGKIALSLRKKIAANEVRINLVAGIKKNVKEYFETIKKEVDENGDSVRIIYSHDLTDYFDQFNNILHETDILWTKPSELSFYTALGLPIVMTPAIGSQEKFNRMWVHELRSGIRQENPDYTDQWLYDLLNRGTLAECAWDGFLKARKLGLYKIQEIVETGKFIRENSPVIR